MNQYKGEQLFEGTIYAVVAAKALACLLLLLHVAAMSLSSKAAVEAGRVSFFPVETTLAPYEYILRDGQYLTSFGVSALRMAVGTLVQLSTVVIMAYPCR